MINLSVQFLPTGPVAPTFAVILATLKTQFQLIYGSDIVIDDDSQDGQLIAMYATCIKNSNDAAIAAYNNQSPATAQGVGLSNVVKINGLKRLDTSNSQVVQRVTGTVGLRINNGQVADPNDTNVRWALPAVVIIPPAGFIDVTATAVDPGAIPAGAGTLTYIVTPARGWASTTNTTDATPGDPVEADATLRRRQSTSTAIPALSVKDALEGALQNLLGVGRATVYENDTDAPDANGLPAHSISAVVEGGDNQTIGDTIELYKTPGTGTFGTTAVPVIDPKGLPNTINYFQLALVSIGVLVEMTALAGFVSTTEDLIKGSVLTWLDGLAIGADSELSKLWNPVNLSGASATTFSGQTQGQLDILSATYNATAIYQARLDNMVLTAQTNAGSNVFHVANAANYALGEKIAVQLDNDVYFFSVITNIAGLVVTVADNVPAGRNAPNASIFYVAGDVAIEFNKAAEALVANIITDVH